MCNNYGWICPKCGCVLAPWVRECPHHLPIQGTISTIPPSIPWGPPTTWDPLPDRVYTTCTDVENII